MEIISSVDELIHSIDKSAKTCRLCFKDYLDRNSNIIYGIDEINVDNDKTTIQFIVKDADTFQNPYSIQDVEDEILVIDKSYYIQVVKRGEEYEDVFEVGMSVFNGSFPCNVRSEKRWVMYCV